jgi:plastocyanin
VFRAGLALLLPVISAACGGSDGSPSSPTDGLAAGRTITISSTGVSPSALSIAPGTRVLFVNNDSRPHNMTSDPHPDHTLCPEINVVGLLPPGQSRETGNLNAVRSCGFHDHDNPPPSGNRWTGTLTIR